MRNRQKFKSITTGFITAGIAIAVTVGSFSQTALAAGAETFGSQMMSDIKGLNAEGKVVVMLDPGHDDKHAGARGINGLEEEDINFIIAKACYDKLSTYPNFEVHMTRYSNDCPFPEASSSGEDNKLRVRKAASIGADIYIALHNNISTSGTASGAEVYTPNNNFNPTAAKTANTVTESILKGLETLGVPNRGYYPRNSESGTTYADGSIADYYTVIYHSKLNGFPGMIVEHAFMNNQFDYENFLTDEDFLVQMGISDAEAIAANFSTILNAASNYFEGVFDPEYYYENYTDVAEQFEPEDASGMLEHFINIGMDEARQANETFDPMSYFLANKDLRDAFGVSWRKYYNHYLTLGRYENRKHVGVSEMVGAATVFEGVDYSAVYDYGTYVRNNPDVALEYGLDDEVVLEHFVAFGIPEGRVSGKNFSARSYHNAYSDLRAVFKKDWPKYFKHYIENGIREGRKATGVYELKGYPVKYEDIDYSAVYDYNFYTKKYPDIMEAFGDDEAAVLKHFVTFGMNEGRSGKAGFVLADYKKNYQDLVSVFGNDNKLYYLHYIMYGQKEGRTAEGPIPAKTPAQTPGETPSKPQRVWDESQLHPIMGDTETTVSQMSAYFSSKADYPDYYIDSDAPTLDDFCRIYLEECLAEGVRTEVAFCQAMLETGFLKFDGQVSIEQYNFAGIGALLGGNEGNWFSSVREGVRAQVQHLKAYASDDPVYSVIVDPRFDLVDRESAKYIEYLGIQENPWGKGWASADEYGFLILDRMEAMSKF